MSNNMSLDNSITIKLKKMIISFLRKVLVYVAWFIFEKEFIRELIDFIETGEYCCALVRVDTYPRNHKIIYKELIKCEYLDEVFLNNLLAAKSSWLNLSYKEIILSALEKTGFEYSQLKSSSNLISKNKEYELYSVKNFKSMLINSLTNETSVDTQNVTSILQALLKDVIKIHSIGNICLIVFKDDEKSNELIKTINSSKELSNLLLYKVKKLDKSIDTFKLTTYKPITMI